MFGLDPLPRTVEAALRDAHDPKAWVRASAVRDLSRHGEGSEKRRVAATLVQVLRSDPSAEVRGASAVALADVSAEGVTAALLEAANDPTLHVRQMAILALGEIGEAMDPTVLSVLTGALRDEAAPIRFQALIARARLFPESSESILMGALSDADHEIRHVALRLLEEKSGEHGDGLRPSQAVIDAAKEALADSHVAVRTAAAILLCRAGEAAGHALIAAACAYRGKGLDAEDEQAAIEVAGELRLESARAGLLSRAFGPLGFRRTPSSHAARVALARMGDPRAEQSILTGLRSWNRDVRGLAVVAAGRAHLAAARAALLELRGDPSRAEPELVETALSEIGAEEP